MVTFLPKYGYVFIKVTTILCRVTWSNLPHECDFSRWPFTANRIWPRSHDVGPSVSYSHIWARLSIAFALVFHGWTGALFRDTVGMRQKFQW